MSATMIERRDAHNGGVIKLYNAIHQFRSEISIRLRKVRGRSGGREGDMSEGECRGGWVSAVE
jgi:hypothetical protein